MITHHHHKQEESISEASRRINNQIHLDKDLIQDIKELVNTTPNDQELGSEIRKLINNQK